MNEITDTSQSIRPRQTEASVLTSNKYNALIYGYHWSSTDITYSTINEIESSFSNDYLTGNLNNLVASRLNFSSVQAEAISKSIPGFFPGYVLDFSKGRFKIFDPNKLL